MNKSQIDFYVDTLIVEAILADERLYKKADTNSLVMSLIGKIKEYVSNHIDPNNKAASIITILGPGVILNAFGFKWLSLLITLAMNIFNIDVSSIISSILNKLKGSISGDNQVSSEQVDSMVSSSIKEFIKPATQDEIDKAERTINKVGSFKNTMKDTRIVKLTLLDYYYGNVIKYADFKSGYNLRKLKVANILTSVLSWIFKVGLASAGLMVAGDVVNKLIGRPNALDGSVEKGKVVEDFVPKPQAAFPPTTQTKFKVNTSYKIERNNTNSAWTENVPNNESSIGEMLVHFAKLVYDGLNGYESNIKSSPGFQAIQDRIVFFNRNTLNSPVVFIPSEFTSKKQMVDYFIDDVAETVK